MFLLKVLNLTDKILIFFFKKVHWPGSIIYFLKNHMTNREL